MSFAYASRAAPTPRTAALVPKHPAATPVRSSAAAQRVSAALPVPVRLRLERAFGADLSSVHVQQDSADAQRLGTRAFTTGANIHLAPGNRSDDLRLMAHETAHVLQAARGNGYARAALSLGGHHGQLESEARQAADTVAAGGRFAVQGRAGEGAVLALRLGDVIQQGVAFLREHARDIPGYDLLGQILGRDPISQQPVARNAANLLRALLGLIPGGAQIFENLQQARAIERAFAWVSGELDRLGLTWTAIRGAIDRFLGSLGLADLLNPFGVLRRAGDLFASFVQRVGAFVMAAGQRILEFVFEGALALGGGAAQRILALLRRAGATFRAIVEDPVGFLSNLINAVMGSFRQFAGNIVEHLRTGLFDWLVGALAGSGLHMPPRLDVAGIIDLVLQVLGLTYANLRERLVRRVGESAVHAMEGALEFLRTVLTQGLAGAWRQIAEFTSNLAGSVITGIRDFVVTHIVQTAVMRLLAMFNPAGAVINAILAIYSVIEVTIDRVRQLTAFVASVLDSIGTIARGNIGAAMAYIEQALSRTVTQVIAFMTALLGLGGIAGRIRQLIGQLRGTVSNALDRVVEWIVQRARSTGVLPDRGASVGQPASPRSPSPP